MTALWIVVTGLDGSGKSSLVARLAESFRARAIRLPYHDFVRALLPRSGDGTPFGDVHTDRLMFALDARLANYEIRDLRAAGVDLVSQRGWMDNFIFGAAQGVSYQQSDALLRTRELERPSAHVCLVAAPEVAMSRLEGSDHRDKYETAAFLARQLAETTRFFDAAARGDARLGAFAGIPSTLIDTTTQNCHETYLEAMEFLAERGFCAQAPAAHENFAR